MLVRAKSLFCFAARLSRVPKKRRTKKRSRRTDKPVKRGYYRVHNEAAPQNELLSIGPFVNVFLKRLLR